MFPAFHPPDAWCFLTSVQHHLATTVHLQIYASDKEKTKKKECNSLSYNPFLLFRIVTDTYFTSSKLNNIDNQTLYYTMVQIW